MTQYLLVNGDVKGYEETDCSKVSHIPKQFVFISDSQEVEHIKEQIPDAREEDYDSFFVWAIDGDYFEIYGMFGIVPYNHKTVWKVKLPNR